MDYNYIDLKFVFRRLQPTVPLFLRLGKIVLLWVDGYQRIDAGKV